MRKLLIQAATVGFVPALLLLFAGSVQAQDPPFECDDAFGQCGTPDMSGGGGCGCGGGSILINNTDLGDTYQHADDFDNDGVEDPYDNCPQAYNVDQGERDGDGVGDACDVCDAISNADQADIDGDFLGDVCDGDMDGDTILNAVDSCARIPNPDQIDIDGDALGNACDDDADGDGLLNSVDSCPLSIAASGAACDTDSDGDSVGDFLGRGDNCRTAFNPDQADLDLDGMGDACDPDMDADGIFNVQDNCPGLSNADQVDSDRDGIGTLCDPRFCYTVNGASGSCLDPTGEFAVFGLAWLTPTGRALRAPAWVNRPGSVVDYQWEVVGQPTGSRATVSNPVGSALASVDTYELQYDAARVPSFTADVEGTYRLRVTVTGTVVDPVSGEVGASAQYLTDVVAQGEVSGSDGCSVNGAGSSSGNGLAILGMVAVGLFVAVRRRRR